LPIDFARFKNQIVKILKQTLDNHGGIYNGPTIKNKGLANMKRLSLFSFLFLIILYCGKTFAFDAQTMLINTAVQNEDVKTALTQGLTVDFDKTFPSSQYGVYVLVDKAKQKVAGKDMVYMLIGLCKVKADGSYSLPLVTISTNLPFVVSNTEKADLVKRLTIDANEFAQVMVANAAKVKSIP
jgi:hypothetical protein